MVEEKPRLRYEIVEWLPIETLLQSHPAAHDVTLLLWSDEYGPCTVQLKVIAPHKVALSKAWSHWARITGPQHA